MDGAATPVQIAGFVVALRGKGETVDEVSGMARAMLEHASPISVAGPIVDLVGTGGGAQFPTLPNPALSNPPPLYTPDIDNGIVTFDNSGVLHTIDWQTFMVGLQYYLPPTGRVIVSANYTQAYSQNMGALYPQGGAALSSWPTYNPNAAVLNTPAWLRTLPVIPLFIGPRWATCARCAG